MGKPDFRTVDGTISGALEDGKIMSVSRVENNGIYNILKLGHLLVIAWDEGGRGEGNTLTVSMMTPPLQVS